MHSGPVRGADRRAGVAHRRLPLRPPGDPDAEEAPAHRPVAHDLGRRRAREQPQERHGRLPARRADGRHRRQRLGQVDARERHPLRGARHAAERRPAGRRQAHARHRPRQPRQGRARRPGADRPHAAVEPRDLHGGVRPHPHALQRDARGEGARLSARPLQLQRQGRPLRGVLRRRHDQDRDELPARRLRRLRGVPRQAVQPRHPRGALQGQEHRRGARDADRRGGGVLRADPGDPPLPAHPRRRRPRLRAARAVGDDALRRRGAAREARDRAAAPEQRPQHLRARRADDGPALRGRAQAARGAQRARRQGQHRHRHRAQPRRDQVVRLDHRPRARGRLRRRRDHRDGHAREGGRRPRAATPASSSRRCSTHRLSAARPAERGPHRAPVTAVVPPEGRRDPHQPRRLPLPRRRGPRAVRRQGEEPPRPAVELLRAAAHAARAHPPHGHDRGIRRVDRRRERRRLPAARVHVDQGVRSAVQRPLPRRQVLPLHGHHARRRGARA